MHFATIGWILPQLHDPDGHEVRFYTTTHHSEPPSQGVVRIENLRETAEGGRARDARRPPVSVTPLRQQALIRAAGGGQPHTLRGVAAGSPDTEEILKLSYAA